MRLLIPCIAATFGTVFTVDGRRLGETPTTIAADPNEETSCPPAGFATAQNVDLEAYASNPWYVQEQAPTTYLPESRNYCVTASYKLLDEPTWPWGYSIEVTNKAQDLQKNTYGGTIYAAQKDGPSKLEVAPGFLPRFLAGPYYILDYQEEGELGGYALIIGGVPDYKSDNGRCRTNNKWINSSGGLWIFTREVNPDSALIDMVRQKAENMGLDTTVLNVVDHSNCDYEFDDEPEQVAVSAKRIINV